MPGSYPPAGGHRFACPPLAEVLSPLQEKAMMHQLRGFLIKICLEFGIFSVPGTPARTTEVVHSGRRNPEFGIRNPSTVPSRSGNPASSRRGCKNARNL